VAKAFSVKEKAAIRAALLDTSMTHFARFGVRKARIADLCAAVGIAKGSFYAFFASKEVLFMALADARDIRHKADMRSYLLQTNAGRREVIGGFFDFMMERINTDPVLKIVRDTGELVHLSRSVPPEMLAENTRRDLAFVDEVATILRERHGVVHADAKTLTGLMSLMLALGVQADVLAAATDYDAMVALLRDLFVSRLLRGPLGDDQGD